MGSFLRDFYRCSNEAKLYFYDFYCILSLRLYNCETRRSFYRNTYVNYLQKKTNREEGHGDAPDEDVGDGEGGDKVVGWLPDLPVNLTQNNLLVNLPVSLSETIFRST